MILFGHLGLGLKMARPFSGKSEPLPLGWLLLGTILPDLIDKPTYYLLTFLTGRQGAALGVFSGTRLFAHTALFLAALALVAAIFRSKPLAALALGAATHLLIDHLGDSIGYAVWPVHEHVQLDAQGRDLSLVGLLWPFLGNHFPVSPHPNLGEHLRTFFRPHIWIGELAGFFFLYRDQRAWDKLWKRAYSPFRPRSSS